MTLLGWTFEGQTNGVAPTVANSDDFGDPAWTAVSLGGFVTYSTAQAMHGTVSMLVNVTTAGTSINADKTDTASASWATSDYIFITAYPTVDAQGPTGERGNGNTSALSRCQITPTGQLRNIIGATTGTASTSVLSLNTWYRLEQQGTGYGTASTSRNIDVYLGDNTGTPLFTVPAVTGVTTSFTVDTIRRTKFGGTTTISFHLDDCRQNIGSATAIGPSALFAAVTQTTTETDTVTGVTGAVATTSQTTTAGATVTAGALGVNGSVAQTTTASSTVAGAVGKIGAATQTTTAGASVAGVVGAVVGTSQTTTVGASVTGSTAGGGGSVLGDVAQTTTAGASVAGVVGKIGATTQTTTAGASVAGVVGVRTTVTQTTTAGATVTAGALGTVGGVAATTTAGGTVTGRVGAVATIASTTTAGAGVSGFVGKLATITQTISTADTVAGSTLTGNEAVTAYATTGLAAAVTAISGVSSALTATSGSASAPTATGGAG